MNRIWFILQDGQRVLLLEDARQEDMFWYSFRTVGLVPDGLDLDLKSLWERALEIEDPFLGYRYGDVIAGEERAKSFGERVSLRGVVVAAPELKHRSWWAIWKRR